MMKQLFRFAFFLLIYLTLPLSTTAQVVDIPDPHLRAAIEERLGYPSGTPITTADMERLTELWAEDADITDLTGLEGATNLTWLLLGGNQIEDIGPLAGLTKLKTLQLGYNAISDISPVARLIVLEALSLQGNAISDISPLAGLTNLTFLWLDGNQIEDIGPLAGLTKLTTLRLSRSSISDISALVGLTKLTELALGNISISDISPLTGLTNLTYLNLSGNNILDLSPLVANTGFGEGDEVNVRGNPLNLASIETHIPALLDRGVAVESDMLLGSLVNIPDPILRYAIERNLGKARGTPITTVDMKRLRRLRAPNANITNLSGLESATNLTGLDLGTEYVEAEGRNINSNSVSDLSPLPRLTNLRYLVLDSNNISDISAVAGLTNLESLSLSDNSISDISAVAGLTNLTWLILTNNSISDISAVAGLTNLTRLILNNNSISDISAVAELTNLTFLWLQNNSISDLSPLVENMELGEKDRVDVRGNPLNDASINTHIPALQNRGVTVHFDNVITELVNIPDANLRAKIEDVLGKASGATITTADIANLTRLEAQNANISDLTGLEDATNLTELFLWDNKITDISVVADLTNLTGLHLGSNKVSDISPVAGLTRLTTLHLPGNNISDASVVAGLTQLTYLNLNGTNITDLSFLSGLTSLSDLYLGWNNITDISVLSGLTNLTVLWLMDNNISDLSPLVANTGLGKGDRVDVSENPLSYRSINTHIPLLQSRGVEVRFENLKSPTSEYTLSIPAGISLIHIPLKVTAVDGEAKTIESISHLYDVLNDALRGRGAVNFLITYDSQTQGWLSYFSASDTDRELTDDMGIIVGLTASVSIHLRGNALGENGSSTVTLTPGLNLVGIPLRDERINRVSDLLRLDGIWGNVPVITLSDGGEFKVVGRAGDPGDIAITGGQAFILTAQQRAMVTISGDGWYNVSGAAASPRVTLKGIEVGDTTPVLGLRGAIVDEETDLNKPNFRVTVKNLSTGRAVAGMTKDEVRSYQLAVVDIETARAARIGDILEISAQSPNPFIGVEPLRYIVTAEDVKQSLIQLPNLVAYEIPAETELLANYPNPFNPETWIPYRLAEDAFVTLTIYDQTGKVIHTLDVGHRIAAVYESRSKAIYWDGRNELGESVASGIYFYYLSAGDYSATHKMLIIK